MAADGCVRHRIINELSLIGDTYDAAGNILSIASSHPEGVGMAFGHDVLSRLKTVADANARTTIYGCDDVGNLHSVALPNGVVSGYQCDALNRLVSLQSESDGFHA